MSRTLVLTIAMTLGLVAAACGSPDDGQTGTGPDASAETTLPSSEQATSADEDPSDGEATDEPELPTTADDDSSDPVPADPEPVDPADEPAPADEPLPTTAEELTSALSEAELALRTPGVTEESARPWGRRSQTLYRVLYANPSWAETVLAGVDPTVADAVAKNWEARQDLSALVNSERLHDTVPAWRIVAPAPADELLGYYREASEATGVPWEVLAAINLIETRMGRISGVSTAGAIGPMQFLPTTWAECCEGDPQDNHDAIRGAAEYLIDRGAANDLDRAIFGYNNSDRYVGAVQSYAAVMMDNPDAYYGYHSWQVLFLSTDGLLLLPEGYEEPEAVPVDEWIVANPDSLLDLSAS